MAGSGCLPYRSFLAHGTWISFTVRDVVRGADVGGFGSNNTTAMVSKASTEGKPVVAQIRGAIM